MKKRIVLMGVSHIGKTTIAKHLERKLGLYKFSTDTLCALHSYTKGNSDDEFLDDLEEVVYHMDPDIVDIGANTIDTFGDDDIKKLKQILGEDSIYIHLIPGPSKYQSNNFILSQMRSSKHYPSKRIRECVANDLNCDVYNKLATTTINTLQSKKGRYPILYSMVDSNTYKNMLDDISNTIIAEYSTAMNQSNPNM